MAVPKYNGNEWIGQKYNMLTVIGTIHKGNQWFWEVKCDCGNVTTVMPRDVLHGHTKSCGCYKLSGKQTPIVHGESHTPLHNIWCGMNNRCNPNHKNSERYGGRGIQVCDEWSDYTKFAKWARENGYEEGLTIERKDVNGDYCPENCTWISLGRQARNRRTTFWVDYNGERISLAEAAERAGLTYKEVHYRIKKLKWPIERALSEPIKTGENSLRRRCKEAGMNYNRVYNRIFIYGWSEEEALSIPILPRGANGLSYKKYKDELRI